MYVLMLRVRVNPRTVWAVLCGLVAQPQAHKYPSCCWRITTSSAASPLVFMRQQPLRLGPFVLRKVAHSQIDFLSTLEWGNVVGGNIAGEMVIRQILLYYCL